MMGMVLVLMVASSGFNGYNGVDKMVIVAVV
jgi:hypothetical protein